jgi:hypothetical protein
LRNAIQNLFAGDGEVSILYFAGHGHIEATGGYLCTSDVKSGNDGVPLAEIMTMANQSRMQNRVIILDSCYGGVAGGSPLSQRVAEISEGVFTNLLVDALGGAAGNLVGDVTPGGVYAHVDQSLGPWAQRPVFKTNVNRFVSLRKVQPPLELSELRQISDLFTAPGYHFQLDPTYEPERHESSAQNPQGIPAPIPEHNKVFSVLQKYNHLGLVVPENAPHMWHAAMESTTIRLTALGEHYRKLSVKGLI